MSYLSFRRTDFSWRTVLGACAAVTVLALAHVPGSLVGA